MLTDPQCKLGYPESQLEIEMSPDELKKFFSWMRGQTFSSCDGRMYNHETKEYEETGCGPHGYVYYPEDVYRFLYGWKVVD